MPNRNDHEIVDRIIQDHLTAHHAEQLEYATNPIFHHDVDLSRNVLYEVCAAARTSGIGYDATVAMLRKTVTSLIRKPTSEEHHHG
jgi:hypothetical protein